MTLTIHRGAKQIGGSIVEVAAGTTRIILDCGKSLPPVDGADAADELELDGLTQGESAYDAVFITHHHADHCGLAERVNPGIPLYMSAGSKAVLEVVADFTSAPPPRNPKILEHGQAVLVGDIRVLPLGVRHSARGAMMFLVEAGGKKLLYTGDFNHMDASCLDAAGHIDALLCEGTNIGAKIGMTEEDVERRAAHMMEETQGHVFVLSSTTNLDRVEGIARACRESGRTLAIDPFMNAILERLAPALPVSPVGFVPHFIDRKRSPRAHKYLSANGKGACGVERFLSAEAVAKRGKLTLLVRQTMGDFLERLNRLVPLAGSTLIYSMWRGYEEAPATKEFLALCRSLGMTIKYLHTSGHAYRQTLEQVVCQLNPGALVPIHTENARAFRTLHPNVILPEDGVPLRIWSQKPALLAALHTASEEEESRCFLGLHVRERSVVAHQMKQYRAVRACDAREARKFVSFAPLGQTPLYPEIAEASYRAAVFGGVFAICLAQDLGKPAGQRDVYDGNRGNWPPQARFAITTVLFMKTLGTVQNGNISSGTCKSWVRHWPRLDEAGGSGLLAQILPLAFVSGPAGLDIPSRLALIRVVCKLDGEQDCRVIACHIYLEYAIGLLSGTPQDALSGMRESILGFYKDRLATAEFAPFKRLLQGNLTGWHPHAVQPKDGMAGSLEAALHCLLTTSNIQGALKKAARLHPHVASIAGGLAGVYYGLFGIDEDSLLSLERGWAIFQLLEGFYEAYPYRIF